MKKYSNPAIILCSLLLTIFENKAAEQRSIAARNIVVGGVAGVTTFTAWQFYKKFRYPAPSPAVEHNPDREKRELTFADIASMPQQAPRPPEWQVYIEVAQTLKKSGLFLDPEEPEKFPIELEPWDTLATIQEKIAVSGIPPEKQGLLLAHYEGKAKKIEKLEDLSTVLTAQHIHVYRKE